MRAFFPIYRPREPSAGRAFPTAPRKSSNARRWRDLMTAKLERVAIAPKNPLLNASRAGNLPHVPGIRVGDYIFLSGMVPIDPATGERSHGPIAEQVRVTLANMRHMLESAGSSLEPALRVHVVLGAIH